MQPSPTGEQIKMRENYVQKTELNHIQNLVPFRILAGSSCQFDVFSATADPLEREYSGFPCSPDQPRHLRSDLVSIKINTKSVHSYASDSKDEACAKQMILALLGRDGKVPSFRGHQEYA
jgi:hypothetical protein